MKKHSMLPGWQCFLPWILSSLFFVSTFGTGAPLKVDDDAISFTAEERADLPEDRSEESAHNRQRRVVGGQPASWRQYPWLAGLEQISKKTRNKLLKTPPSPTTTPSVLPVTTDPVLALLNSTAPPSVLPSLLTKKIYPETSDFECSAILVHRLWAMTAAHCLDDNKGKALRKFVKLTFVDPVKDEVMIRTSRFYINHPDFRDVKSGNDIAFILLDEAVDNIAPVNIDWNDISDYKIELTKPVAKACGWGRSKARKDVYPKRLQCVSLNLVTGKTCNELYNPYKEQGLISHTDSELCAGVSDYKKDTCFGDSGGPLFQNRMNSETDKNEVYLIALVSHGDRCAKRGKPGIYARVSHFEHLGRCILKDGLECDYVSNFLTKHQKLKLLKGRE